MSTREALRAALEEFSKRPVSEPDLSSYNDAWQLTGENHWHQIDPKEDLAVAPALEWPDEVKRLALTEYCETFGRFLKPGQYYVLVWPPEGFLDDGGDWGWPDVEACDEHDPDERDPDCEQCQRLFDAQEGTEPVCYAPATWSWTLEVQTWQIAHGPDGQVRPFQVIDDDGPERETWYLGCTTMKPWEVWFAA